MALRDYIERRHPVAEHHNLASEILRPLPSPTRAPGAEQARAEGDPPREPEIAACTFVPRSSQERGMEGLRTRYSQVSSSLQHTMRCMFLPWLAITRGPVLVEEVLEDQ
jgi:hypothetical protein